MLPKRIKLHQVRCQSGHDVRWNRRSYTMPVNGQINNDMSYKTTTEHKDRRLLINVQSTCYLILQQLPEITKKEYGKRNESSWGESQPGLPPKRQDHRAGCSLLLSAGRTRLLRGTALALTCAPGSRFAPTLPVRLWLLRRRRCRGRLLRRLCWCFLGGGRDRCLCLGFRGRFLLLPELPHKEIKHQERKILSILLNASAFQEEPCMREGAAGKKGTGWGEKPYIYRTPRHE